MSEERPDVPEQVAAVEATESRIAVLAGPGSGKTRTLSHRIRHLLTEQPGSAALALTFTNKAAAEMKARALAATVKPEKIRAQTFHGFGVSVLRDHGERVGITREFEIMDSEETTAFARAMGPGASRYLNFWGQARRCGERVSEAVAAFGERYEQVKRAEGVVDFDDLVYYPSQIFREHPEVVASYARQFSHLLVDEFQDTNYAQFGIVAGLAPQMETVSVFADDDQAIFSFAGAERANIARFVKDLGAKTYSLTFNYRCYEEIIRHANRLNTRELGGSGRAMRKVYDGGTVEPLVFANAREEAKGIAELIDRRIADGQPAHEIAVLTPRAKHADLLVDALRALKRPVTDWRGDLFHRRERRLFATATLALHDTLKDRQARQLCGFMDVALSEERVTDDLLEAHAGNAVAEELRVLRRLAIDGAAPAALAEQVRNAVVASDPDTDKTMAHLVETVADLQAHDPQFDLDSLLAELVLGAGGRSPTDDQGVKVATLHKTKGLEWPTVYILGFEQGTMPDFRSMDDEEQIAEDRRVCFVGVCRAERELFLSRCRELYEHSKPPSQFLYEMGVLGSGVDRDPYADAAF